MLQMSWRLASAELAIVASTFPTSTKSLPILGPLSSRPPLMSYLLMVTPNKSLQQKLWCFWFDCERWSGYRCYSREIIADASAEKYQTWSKTTQNQMTAQVEAKIPSQQVFFFDCDHHIDYHFSITDSSHDKQDNWGVCGGNGNWPPPSYKMKWPASSRWQLNDCLTTTVQTNWFQAFSCLPWWSITWQYFGQKNITQETILQGILLLSKPPTTIEIKTNLIGIWHNYDENRAKVTNQTENMLYSHMMEARDRCVTEFPLL